MKGSVSKLLAIATAVVASTLAREQAGADELIVEMKQLTPQGTSDPVGTIHLQNSGFGDGLVLDPSLYDLPPGPHGFHVHENPSCAPSRDNGEAVPGGDAGGHLDPEGTGRHAGPYANGHLGDLPVIWVGPAGDAQTPLFAPRLTVERVRGHALIIHADGDNYSDRPKPLGGSGARIACGVVR